MASGEFGLFFKVFSFYLWTACHSASSFRASVLVCFYVSFAFFSFTLCSLVCYRPFAMFIDQHFYAHYAILCNGFYDFGDRIRIVSGSATLELYAFRPQTANHTCCTADSDSC